MSMKLEIQIEQGKNPAHIKAKRGEWDKVIKAMAVGDSVWLESIQLARGLYHRIKSHRMYASWEKEGQGVRVWKLEPKKPLQVAIQSGIKTPKRHFELRKAA